MYHEFSHVFFKCVSVLKSEIWQDGNADERTIKEIKDVKSFRTDLNLSLLCPSLVHLTL